MEIIKSKWIVKYKNWFLGITKDKEVYDLNTNIKLVNYINNGCLSFRIPGTNKKIGKNTINKHCRIKEVEIKFIYPWECV